MHASLLLTAPDGELYSIERLAETPFSAKQMDAVFEATVRFTTPGQHIFLGMLDTTKPWSSGDHIGFGIKIDTEDGTITDMVNDLGVLDYINSAPLPADTDIPIKISIEKQNRVLIAQITVGTETFLHPALYLDKIDSLGAFGGTTILWGGSAQFFSSRMRATDPFGAGQALSS